MPRFAAIAAVLAACSVTTVEPGAGLTRAGDHGLAVDPQAVPVVTGDCADGQVLARSGDGWACATPASSAFGMCDSGDVANGIDAKTGRLECTPAVAPDAYESRLAAVEARLATLEAAMCPPGFTYAPADGYDICTRTIFGVTDEIVKVGDFWIDRYELSACPGSGALGTDPANDTTAWACSAPAADVQTDITWFQAAALCANAGKRLCTNLEWQTATSGTPDPGSSNGSAGECLTAATGRRATALGTACRSRFGAEDMIGNVWEWVADWMGGPRSAIVTTPALYGSDVIHDVAVAAGQGGGGGFPAALRRGDTYGDATLSGSFSMSAGYAPSGSDYATGARCCIGGR